MLSSIISFNLILQMRQPRNRLSELLSHNSKEGKPEDWRGTETWALHLPGSSLRPRKGQMSLQRSSSQNSGLPPATGNARPPTLFPAFLPCLPHLPPPPQRPPPPCFPSPPNSPVPHASPSHTFPNVPSGLHPLQVLITSQPLMIKPLAFKPMLPEGCGLSFLPWATANAHLQIL